MIIGSIFIVSFASLIFCLRQLGKQLIFKPLFYLGGDYSVSAKKLERNYKTLVYGIFSLVSFLSTASTFDFIIKALEKNL